MATVLFLPLSNQGQRMPSQRVDVADLNVQRSLVFARQGCVVNHELEGRVLNLRWQQSLTASLFRYCPDTCKRDPPLTCTSLLSIKKALCSWSRRVIWSNEFPCSTVLVKSQHKWLGWSNYLRHSAARRKKLPYRLRRLHSFCRPTSTEIHVKVFLQHMSQICSHFAHAMNLLILFQSFYQPSRSPALGPTKMWQEESSQTKRKKQLKATFLVSTQWTMFEGERANLLDWLRPVLETTCSWANPIFYQCNHQLIVLYRTKNYFHVQLCSWENNRHTDNGAMLTSFRFHPEHSVIHPDTAQIQPKAAWAFHVFQNKISRKNVAFRQQNQDDTMPNSSWKYFFWKCGNSIEIYCSWQSKAAPGLGIPKAASQRGR